MLLFSMAWSDSSELKLTLTNLQHELCKIENRCTISAIGNSTMNRWEASRALQVIGVLYFSRSWSQSMIVLNDAFWKGDCVFRAQKRLLRLCQRPRKETTMRMTFCKTNTSMTIWTRVLILMTGDLKLISSISWNDQATCLFPPCFVDRFSSWCMGWEWRSRSSCLLWSSMHLW